jgi:hypothetical protein
MITATLPQTRSSARQAEWANSWLQWRPELPEEPQRLTVAELAECVCPDLCDRDHTNA